MPSQGSTIDPDVREMLENRERHRLLVQSCFTCTDTASRQLMDLQSMLHHNSCMKGFKNAHYGNVVRAWNDILDLDSALRAELERIRGGTHGKEDGGEEEGEEEVSG